MSWSEDVAVEGFEETADGAIVRDRVRSREDGTVLLRVE
jgi:hypothetical protein